MTVTHTKLSKHFAAEVRGIDIAAGVSAKDFAEVERLFDEHSVLVFPDKDIDDDQQVEFSRRFGALERTIKINDGGGSEITIFTNVHPETDQKRTPCTAVARLRLEETMDAQSRGRPQWSGISGTETGQQPKRIPRRKRSGKRGQDTGAN